MHRMRVFIVDDSAVMRSLLRSVISSDPSLEVAGTAVDGRTALAGVEDLHPDMVLLDVEMPVMDGLLTLGKLRQRGHRMPVIMCSSLTQRGARTTIEALARGASDYVAKPAGQVSPTAAIQALAQELLPKIHGLMPPQPKHASSSTFTPTLPALLPAPPGGFETSLSNPAIVVIGASTGGPAALDLLLPSLPADFPLPVLVVQHMPELFTGLLAERLASRCPLQVREAADGDMVRPGTVHIARGDWHLEVLPAAHASRPCTLHLTQKEPENHCRPAVDVLFRTAVTAYGSRVLAIMLTGMGSDGLAGSHLVRTHGGVVLAQDHLTSAVWGMPGAVTRAGLANRVLPVQAIAGEILRLTGSQSLAEAEEVGALREWKVS
jgi:two-component system, chemotaxis family, protein-glutamate methylesterase/glutaminase